MATNIYLWVVFTLLTVYSLAMVTLIVKKVNKEKLKKQKQKKKHFALNLFPY